MADEFIDISQLGERTSAVNTDLMHVRSAGGIDSKISVTNFLKSVLDSIRSTITAATVTAATVTASTSVKADLMEELTLDNGVEIESVLLKDGIVTPINGVEVSKTYSSGVNETSGAWFTQFTDNLVIGKKVLCCGAIENSLVTGEVLIASYMIKSSATFIEVYGVVNTVNYSGVYGFSSGSSSNSYRGTLSI